MWHVWHVWMVKWSRHIGARFEQQGDALRTVVPCGDLWQHKMHRDMHGRFSSLAVAERLWRHSEQILQTCNPFSFDLVCFLHGYCWTIIRRLSLFLHLFFCAKIYHELCKTLPCESVCPWSVCVWLGRWQELTRSVPVIAQYCPTSMRPSAHCWDPAKV